MTRHARNCTAGAVYTYHEKKKDAQASGYGTNTQRVGKDSIKDFDCCSLTLQPCLNPVVTSDGILFDKEAILEYIITKKHEYCRKLKEYEKQKRKEEVKFEYLVLQDGYRICAFLRFCWYHPVCIKLILKKSAYRLKSVRTDHLEMAIGHPLSTSMQTELAELAAAEERSKLNSFVKTEKNIVSAPIKAFKSDSQNNEKPSVSNMTEGRDKHLPSFWIPSKTPEAKDKSLKKPDKTIYCPVSGKPLKAKDLIDIKFLQVKDPDDKKALIVKENRYIGDVITMECVEKIIKKDWIHPLTGAKLKESDIIPLQRVITVFN
ncbi:Nitric oxide synthase-interacting protein [Blattella germanica]|nr:Nitric oxide synthase-interacting protein [Blattella germanica]